MQVVWFKRDLRVVDHAPLATACAAGAPVLPLYVVEPDLWRQPEAAGRQWAALREALVELRDDLAALGQPLVVRRGEVTAVLAEVHARHGISALHSHMETGGAWTFARDRAVGAWCRGHGVPWHEHRQFGVHRPLQDRDGWARQWDALMAEPLVAAPPALAPLPNVEPGVLPEWPDPALPADPCPGRQRGGRRHGLRLLDTFLERRGEDYRSAMSSPLDGASACSRLSVPLATGAVSMREASQATRARQAALRDDPAGSGLAPDALKAFRASLASFNGRLHWHCHFTQKLEDEPHLETRSMHPAFDAIRQDADPALLAAWRDGTTGLPFVDACIRCLRDTGWLNFRMRAMLVAVASYHLWLPWQQTGQVLARRFTDYEPGIHWPQVQMQSGCTGINTLRIYNPVKQGHDQDPAGRFVRRWLPELASVPDAHLQEPWAWAGAATLLGKAYPERVVDHLQAAKDARQRIGAVRRSAGFREQAEQVFERHGSRRRPRKRRATRGAARRST